MGEPTHHSVVGEHSLPVPQSFIVSELLSDGTVARHAIPYYAHLQRTSSEPGFAAWKDRNVINPSLTPADGHIVFGVG